MKLQLDAKKIKKISIKPVGINPESKMSTVPDIATPIQCKRCGLINPKSHEFCGGCTAPLIRQCTNKARKTFKRVRTERHVRRI